MVDREWVADNKTARRGDWVQIRVVVLTPEDRAVNIPEDTARVPLEMRVKGFLLNDEGMLGNTVTIETVTGRQHSGMLCQINPAHEHNFGEPVPELLTIGKELRNLLG